jgi:hypothetical protein
MRHPANEGLTRLIELKNAGRVATGIGGNDHLWSRRGVDTNGCGSFGLYRNSSRTGRHGTLLPLSSLERSAKHDATRERIHGGDDTRRPGGVSTRPHEVRDQRADHERPADDIERGRGSVIRVLLVERALEICAASAVL